MCGIICIFKTTQICKAVCEQQFQQFKKYIENRGPDQFRTLYECFGSGTIYIGASVLWLQGETLADQPIVDDYYLMAYNGDIYNGLDGSQKEVGDTRLFFEYLKMAINNPKERISGEMFKLQGPYAFIFLDKKDCCLYFARDIFGRRSLLLGRNIVNGTFILTSVAKRTTENEFVEVPSIGIFCMDFTGKLVLYKWPCENQNFSSKVAELEKFLGEKIKIVLPPTLHENSSVKEFDKTANFMMFKNITYTDDIFERILNNENCLVNVMKLKELLEIAISVRISRQPKFCKNCIKNKEICQHATTGVLFSGGVDCALLALLCDKYVEPGTPIDLINVSFDEVNQYQSPDRITGLQTMKELQICCPDRKWNFVEVDISKKILDRERQDRIADLIYPLNTILDDSLGCALWFASRGQSDNYSSTTRVLLVGMGADELFGGYTKHRAALKRSSWEGLQASLENDWQNLPYRNLGRDDRVVSDHGRQLRTPYLDENVVRFVRSLPCWERTFPDDNLPQGVGEKILLRSLAYHVGLKKTALLKKRALQFGSRIANSKENANDVSQRLV